MWYDTSKYIFAYIVELYFEVSYRQCFWAVLAALGVFERDSTSYKKRKVRFYVKKTHRLSLLRL